MNMTVTPWVGVGGRGAPGTADYGFSMAAVEKGWTLAIRAAAAKPGVARRRRWSHRPPGGIPYEMDVQIKLGGSGPMAGLMARMGNITMTNTVDAVETTALADDLFAPPAGYKLNPKK